MSTLPAPGFWGGGLAALGRTLLVAVLGIVALWVARRPPSPSFVSTLSLLGFVGIGGWMFVSRRYTLTLAVLMLYLCLLDGYLKLSTGSAYVTLARDLLLYAIVGGALARFALTKQPIRFPPLSGWVLAFVLVVLVCVF